MTFKITMTHMKSSRSILAAGCLALALALGARAAAPPRPRLADVRDAKAPVHRIGQGLAVAQWLTVGALPNPTADKKLAPRPGYERDYLAAAGGEAHAIFSGATRIAYRDTAGTTRTAAATLIKANPAGVVDFNTFYNMPGPGVAYAFAWIDSPAAQELECFLGSGDGVKIWLGGKEIQAKPASFLDQSCIARQVQFKATVPRGLTPLLVKVENGGGDWAFILELAGAAEGRRIRAELERQKLLQEAQEVELIPQPPGAYIFPPGPFPPLAWKNPALVERAWGKMPLRVRWFDAQLKEVGTATRPGRYAAYVEGRLPDGGLLRRALSFFCAPRDFPLLDTSLTLRNDYAPNTIISRAAWDAHRAERDRLPLARFFSREGAIRDTSLLLAGLYELKGAGGNPAVNDPLLMDQEYQLRLKQKILGSGAKSVELKRPRNKAGAPAPVIRRGTAREAGVKAYAASRIRRACQAWEKEGTAPFAVLVARHGVIVFHEAFASTSTTPVTLQTLFPLDSLTKMVSSLFCLEFFDQGLMRVEDPVGKYLPELPVTGERAITLHECLAHTSGLEGHGSWGGMGNPWLENVIANGAERLRPGAVVIYNGMGFDLLGKAMERLTGRNVFRLMHEHFFDPLGDGDVRLTDMGFAAECTVEDMARIGQLMLNRGSYGGKEYFTPRTFEMMMPRPAAESFPKIARSDWEYGLGLQWMRQPDPEAGRNGVPAGRFILGRNIIGHGAFGTTVLRVDLDHDLVIAVGRQGGGIDFDKHLTAFLRAVEEGLE